MQYRHTRRHRRPLIYKNAESYCRVNHHAQFYCDCWASSSVYTVSVQILSGSTISCSLTFSYVFILTPPPSRWEWILLLWIGYVAHSVTSKLITTSQNENVQRACTSERFIIDLRRPDQKIPMKVLVKKTFQFIDDVGRSYILWKITDLRHVTITNTVCIWCFIHSLFLPSPLSQCTNVAKFSAQTCTVRLMRMSDMNENDNLLADGGVPEMTLRRWNHKSKSNSYM